MSNTTFYPRSIRRVEEFGAEYAAELNYLISCACRAEEICQESELEEAALELHRINKQEDRERLNSPSFII